MADESEPWWLSAQKVSGISWLLSLAHLAEILIDNNYYKNNDDMMAMIMGGGDMLSYMHLQVIQSKITEEDRDADWIESLVRTRPRTTTTHYNFVRTRPHTIILYAHRHSP